MKRWGLVAMLLMVCGMSAMAAQRFFNNHYALVYLGKYSTTKSIDVLAKTYLYELKYDVYTKALNDEFEMAARMAETKKLMQDELGAIQSDDTFYIASSEELGQYDFVSNTFELKPMTKNTYFKLMSYSPDWKGPKSKSVSINFVNPEIVTNMPLSEEAANEFIKSRKDETGTVNRKVYLKIIFNVTGASDKKEDVLAGKILSVEVYEDVAAKKLLYTYGDKVLTNAQKAAFDLDAFIAGHPMPAAMQNDLRGIIEKYK